MNLREKIIKGVSWSGASQAGKLISQFVITIILTRLLSPDDFGLLAMAVVFVNFAMVFSGMGVGYALIQKQDTRDRHYYSVFWFNILVGLCLTLFFIAISPLIAGFYNRPELVQILEVISLNFFFSSFVIIQESILTKEMDFKKLAIRDTSATIIAGVVGIVLAYNGFGVWSLVFQSVIFTLANAVLSWAISSWRPKFAFAIADIKDIFHFSANLTGFNIVNSFGHNIDQLLIGKVLGAQALGYYSLAYKLTLYLIQNISLVIEKVMFPAFSKIQNDLEKVKNVYLRMTKAISLVVFPLMMMFFIIAPEFVRVCLGEKWAPVIILIRIFCFCGLIQSILSTSSTIFLSHGRADVLLRLGTITTFLTLLGTIIGLRWGVVGVSALYTLTILMLAILAQIIVNKHIRMDTKVFLTVILKGFIVSFGVGLSVFIAKFLIGTGDVIVLASAVLLGSFVYVITLIALKEIRVSSKGFKLVY